ncbi:MAG TPA: hypothetical protein VNT01_09095 [Symbiobacteriaceae bacterium]|nr:hypothetical protein [Symbiobacteriaceae bacterium]
MKRTVRFIMVLMLLLGAMVMSQSAMTGACGNTGHGFDCPE